MDWLGLRFKKTYLGVLQNGLVLFNIYKCSVFRLYLKSRSVPAEWLSLVLEVQVATVYCEIRMSNFFPLILYFGF